MTPLLLLTGVLLLVSGLVKLRAAERVGLGVAILPLVEVAAALGLGGLAMLAPPTPAAGLTAVLAAVALIVISSVQVGLAIRGRNRRRELSEGARLRTYVQYLSLSQDPDSSDPRPPGPGPE